MQLTGAVARVVFAASNGRCTRSGRLPVFAFCSMSGNGEAAITELGAVNPEPASLALLASGLFAVPALCQKHQG